MPLPEPTTRVSPFDVILSQTENEDRTNLEALADGSGIDNYSITSSKISISAVGQSTASSNSSASQTYITQTNNPSVTIVVGNSGIALVTIAVDVAINAANSSAYVSFAVSGSTTVAANDNRSLHYQAYASNAHGGLGGAFLVTGLTPGSNTFTMQCRVTGNTGTYNARHLSAVPL